MEKSRKEKNQNIQVFVRLRPLNQRERDIKSLGVVEVCNNKEVVVRQSQQTSLTKKFTYDRAFGPNAKQVEVYHDVVSPLIEEVLAGYNCTVFAYGQTGTGKTHTMVGESSSDEVSWQNDPMAGIIPRSLSQLFDELRLTNSEYTVRVSYLELYNEELFDLLAASDDNSKLRIYEDATRKGSNIVNGLEEVTVYNKNEVYKIMAQGQERRRVASTLMNAQSSNQPNSKMLENDPNKSSRSHTVFTIVVHMKENSPEGEELMKIGKLNLVDLAGSENISKAGSDNPAKKEQRRECVNINQSLLTLGRVITALVERHPHIPYRESKLTRLLQESLGGRTKTSIIATVSPGHKDLEETMSTLEYAYRAKNIQNKPEVNQKMTKKAVLKEYSEEIDRLKRDLIACREKNGVYLANETYTEMTLKIEDQEKEIQEKLLQMKAMKDEKDRMEGIFNDLSMDLKSKEEQLDKTHRKLNDTTNRLNDTKNVLSTTSNHLEEQKHLVTVQSETEAKLSKQAKELLNAADSASTHATCLHDTVNKRKQLEQTNLEATRWFSDTASSQRAKIRDHLDSATGDLSRDLNALSNTLDSHHDECVKRQDENKEQVDSLIEKMSAAISEVKTMVSTTEADLTTTASSKKHQFTERISSHSQCIEDKLKGFLQQLTACIGEARNRDRAAVEEIRQAADEWRTKATQRISELEGVHETWGAAWRDCQDKMADITRRAAERRASDARRHAQQIALQKQHMQEAFQRMISQSDSWCDAMLDQSEQSVAAVETELCEHDTLRNTTNELLEGYCTRFGESVRSMGEVATFTDQVVGKVVEKHEMAFADIDTTRQAVEDEVRSVLAAERETSNGLVQETDAAFTEMLESSKDALGNTVERVESYNATCTTAVHQFASALEQRAKSDATLSRQRASDLRRAEGLVSSLRDDLHAELLSHEQTQETFLTREYRTYSPTGKTPLRQEYRYPRYLAATSPHERIINRFRALRNQCHDDECVEVLDTTPQMSPSASSDTDTSAISEDSAVIFLEPHPPAQTPRQTAYTLNCRSTSESDIYNLQKKEGKENLNHSTASGKKLSSRIRPPSSHKKALSQHN